MRWRSVEAVPDLSDDEDYGIDDDAAAANDSASGVVDRRGQSTSPQPVQPVPPPGPRAPGDSSAPVPRRRSGGARGRRSPGLIEPEPEPEPEPEHVPVREPMGVPIGRGSSGPRTDLPRGGDSPAQPARQPTGVPIRRGSSGGGANSPALPPRSANSPALPGRRPAGVPIRQGSSGGGANSPALPPRDGTDSPALPARLPTPEKTTRMRHGGPRRTARPFIPQDDDEGEQVSTTEPVPPVVPAPPAAPRRRGMGLSRRTQHSLRSSTGAKITAALPSRRWQCLKPQMPGSCPLPSRSMTEIQWSTASTRGRSLWLRFIKSLREGSDRRRHRSGHSKNRSNPRIDQLQE